MASYYRDVIQVLRDAGCEFVRHGKGDHEIWYSPITKTTFPVDHGINDRIAANNTIRDAGLPKLF